MEELGREWHPDAWFPAKSKHSAVLAAQVKGVTWVRLDPDDPDDRNAPPVHVALARAKDGRLVCTALIVGALDPTHELAGREVTSRALRQIRLPEVLEAAARSAEWSAKIGKLMGEVPAARPRVRRRQLDDAHFRDVAEAYRSALVQSPGSPTEWLAKQWHVSPPTLRRWLQRARDKGYLGEAMPGKAGEKPAEEGKGR